MKYYLIAGEASGDLHGSNLIHSLKSLDGKADFRAWGGDMMELNGANVVKHYRDLAFMGFAEVIKNLGTIINNISFCKKDITEFKPDVLILIDYPGFNLRIAKWAKQEGIKVFYYISPQIWAWHTSRVHGIKEWVDKMFVILPFEKDFYAKYNYKVDYVGHPLLDATENRPINRKFREENSLTEDIIVALLPGSRKQEIKNVLPIMMTLVDTFPEFQFVIACAPAQSISFYEGFIKPNQWVNVRLLQQKTYDLLQHASAALVTSGTATLEAAIFEVPQIVCYKGSSVSYAIAKRLIDIKYIALPNLISDKPIVKELIQDELNQTNLTNELKRILKPKQSALIIKEYKSLKIKLGNAGASMRTAQLMIDYLRKN
jgi:lipid-A-disaccharide synthase